MTLVVRWDRLERVVRSVDDLPGIVGAGEIRDSVWSFYVHHGWEPGRAARAAMAKAQQAGASGVIAEAIDPAAGAWTALDIADVIAACQGKEELLLIAQIAGATVTGATAQYGPRAHWEPIGTAVEFAIAVRDAVLARAEDLAA